MTELVVFPDVEAVLAGWLPAQLAARGESLRVVTRTPNPRPAAFVRLVAAGGVRNNLIQDNRTVAYECWGASEAAAATTAGLVRALLLSLRGVWVGSTFVYRVDDLGAPANNPDPDSGSPRYTGAVSVLLRGVAA